MCGPSSSEKSLQQGSENFSQLLNNNYQALYGNQADVLKEIGNSLSPTLAAGPSQQGFSAAELAARNTQAINSSAAAGRNAAQAARTFGAGEGGGGTSGLTSGITKQIEGSIASQTTNNLATQQNNIVNENYQQGNQNYWRAEGGLQTLGQQYGSAASSAETGAINENADSFGQASQITKENNQEAETIAGGITSLAGAAIPFANNNNFLSGLGGGKIFGPGGFFG
jgi:hypothetical protein